ncbi:MAG TPA: gamma-glutamyltransferase, partial [Alphaproteobacteria bacterium]|nr:gamma-glutamyltransferase [Alphaproteobacteria bacterium]
MGTARRIVQGLALTLTLGLPGCYVVNPEADMFGRVNAEIDAGSPVPVAEPYTGGIAADEPNAALVARELLREGGNAADAAAALYFALAVTLPSRAGLGARGACLLYDPVTASVQALEFAAVSTPLPTAAQGMATLHKAYGRVDWRRIIAPA